MKLAKFFRFDEISQARDKMLLFGETVDTLEGVVKRSIVCTVQALINQNVERVLKLRAKSAVLVEFQAAGTLAPALSRGPATRLRNRVHRRRSGHCASAEID